MCPNSKIREARRTAVRRMKREQRMERREYERELERREVPERRREKLLADLRAEHEKQILTFKHRFESAMRRAAQEP